MMYNNPVEKAMTCRATIASILRACIVGSRLSCVALVFVLLASAPSNAQPAVRQVLLLQSFSRGNVGVDQFTSNFRVELDQRAEGPVNVVQVVVGPTGSVSAPEQAVVDYIRSSYVDSPKPDLIVTVAGLAAAFARKHRQQLFPDTPTLFASVDQKYLGDAPLGDNETAVAVVNDYPRVIEDILQLLPQTKQVFMLIGSGQVGQFWRRELEQEFRRFHDRLRFVWFDDLSVADALRRSAGLPENSAIVYVIFGTDTAGAAYADERLFAELHTVANAPLFAGQSVYLGAGIVGGSLLSIADLSRDAAEVAVRLLNGAPPSSLRMTPRHPGQPTFDWRELQRWGIPESRLPPGSVVRYRAPSLWSAHRGTVLSTVGVLAVQSLLIVALLYQRRARQRAEVESRRNLGLAADATRRVTMSALSGSIAHELSQPLNSIMHNAHAGVMLVTSNRATPEMLREILSDIRTADERASQIVERHRAMLRNCQLDTKPIDIHAVVRESVALVAHDTRTRQVQVEVELPLEPCVVTGDQVLLQQVLVNLMMNAMDAMADTPPERRRLRVRNQVTRDAVNVSVVDAGKGLPADMTSQLFEPFVTTKTDGIGIGLTIAHTIVEAHRGSMIASNNPAGGATFTVTLPCNETSGQA